MTELNVPTVTATEVVLPGKVDPSGLRLVQRALPPPAAGQALVRVESTAVSFAESAMRRGRYYGQPPFPFVPGYDLVGVVDAVGPGVNRSLTGRRVAALTKTGGWATAALLTAADLVEVPDGVSADEAETLIVNGVTAYQMLHHSAKVQAGQTVLVLGASGGVGTILVQLARHAGARVIGTASPRHHDALRGLGAEPIDYRDPDLAAPASPAPTGCSAVPAPWSLTASPASSMTPARCCPASCSCWRNWRSGTTCPRASTRASTTSGRVQESRTQPSGKRSGPGCAPISRTCSACYPTACSPRRSPPATRWPKWPRPWNWPSPPAGPPSARSSWCPDGDPEGASRRPPRPGAHGGSGWRARMRAVICRHCWWRGDGQVR